jgi:hypothetical protein
MKIFQNSIRIFYSISYGFNSMTPKHRIYYLFFFGNRTGILKNYQVVSRAIMIEITDYSKTGEIILLTPVQ